VCMMMGVNSGVDGLAYRFYGDVLKRMKLNENDLQQVILETSVDWEQIERFLNLV